MGWKKLLYLGLCNTKINVMWPCSVEFLALFFSYFHKLFRCVCVCVCSDIHNSNVAVMFSYNTKQKHLKYCPSSRSSETGRELKGILWWFPYAHYATNAVNVQPVSTLCNQCCECATSEHIMQPTLWMCDHWCTPYSRDTERKRTRRSSLTGFREIKHRIDCTDYWLGRTWETLETLDKCTEPHDKFSLQQQYIKDCREPPGHLINPNER